MIPVLSTSFQCYFDHTFCAILTTFFRTRNSGSIDQFFNAKLEMHYQSFTVSICLIDYFIYLIDSQSCDFLSNIRVLDSSLPSLPILCPPPPFEYLGSRYWEAGIDPLTFIVRHSPSDAVTCGLLRLCVSTAVPCIRVRSMKLH